MALGFIKVGPQGDGGRERKEYRRNSRRKTVRKPSQVTMERGAYFPPQPSPYAYPNYLPGPALPYKEDYAQHGISRVYENVPSGAHYEVIYPEHPPVRKMVQSIAPRERGEHPKQLQHPKAASYQPNYRRSLDATREQPPARRPRRREEPRRRPPSPFKKNTASYREIRALGIGGQGEIYLVERRTDGRKFVRKVSHTFPITPSGQPLEARILQEVLGQHKRAIKLIEYAIAEDHLITIYDFYPGGDLVSCLPNRNQRQSESFVWCIFFQLADVLAYLHEGFDYRNPFSAPLNWQPVIHCDIKPENVFLRENPRDNPYPDIVLGDFGFATLYPGKRCSGTSTYYSPELEETGNTEASDVWALGATIHELVHGYVPKNRGADPLPKSFSSSLDKIVRSCLTKDPSYRISARELVQRIHREYDKRR